MSSSEMMLTAGLWMDQHPLLEIFLPFEAAIICIHGCSTESLAVTICEGKRLRLWEFLSVSQDCHEKYVSRLEIIRACFHFAIASPIQLPWLHAIWQHVKQSCVRL